MMRIDRDGVLAVDVDYRVDRAVAAGVMFADWSDAEPLKEAVVSCRSGADYVPGGFFRRELPCILRLLREFDPVPGCIVIDAYVSLGREGRPGLGQHLFDALKAKVTVIGVAKGAFSGTPSACSLLRGSSTRPLYVTAAGLDVPAAKQCIQRMYGRHRMPALLKRVDRLSRQVPELADTPG